MVVLNVFGSEGPDVDIVKELIDTEIVEIHLSGIIMNYFVYKMFESHFVKVVSILVLILLLLLIKM